MTQLTGNHNPLPILPSSSTTMVADSPPTTAIKQWLQRIRCVESLGEVVDETAVAGFLMWLGLNIFLAVTPAACARELDITPALLATVVVLAFAAAVIGPH